MAGRVEGDAMGVVGVYILDTEFVYKEHGEFAHPR